MKTFMKKWKWKILILVYLCFIYGNSLTPAAISSKESGYFLAKIQDFLAGAGMDAWWLTEHLVRKAAHFTEYAGLGFLLAMNTGAGIAPVFCLLKGNVTAGFMKMTGALKTGRKAAKGKGSGNRSRNNEL